MVWRPSRLRDLHEQRHWGVKGHGTRRHTVLGDISEVLSEQSYHCRFTSSCVRVGSRRTTSPPGMVQGLRSSPTWFPGWLSQESQVQLSNQLSQGVEGTSTQRQYFSWRLCRPAALISPLLRAFKMKSSVSLWRFNLSKGSGSFSSHLYPWEQVLDPSEDRRQRRRGGPASMFAHTGRSGSGQRMHFLQRWGGWFFQS